MDRYIKNEVTADLIKQLVFLGGSKQVCKTTMSFYVLGELRSGPRLVILYEIHQ